MLGKITVVQEDRKAVFVELEQPGRFKIGDTVNVSKKKQNRTLKQNSMYWAFLTWCIHPAGGDLQSQGHFSKDALHENIKAWIKVEHKHDFNVEEEFTTTELDKKQFGEFFDIINHELMVEKLGLDTSGFWAEYEKYTRWVDFNNDDFRSFMDEQVSEVPF